MSHYTLPQVPLYLRVLKTVYIYKVFWPTSAIIKFILNLFEKQEKNCTLLSHLQFKLGFKQVTILTNATVFEMSTTKGNTL